MKITQLPVHSRDEALAYLEQHPRAGVFVLQLLHDDNCAAIHSQRDADCTAPCQPDVLLIEVLGPAPAGGLN